MLHAQRLHIQSNAFRCHALPPLRSCCFCSSRTHPNWRKSHSVSALMPGIVLGRHTILHGDAVRTSSRDLLSRLFTIDVSPSIRRVLTNFALLVPHNARKQSRALRPISCPIMNQPPRPRPACSLTEGARLAQQPHRDLHEPTPPY